MIYGFHRVLRRTLDLLRNQQVITFPAAYRAWIELVYQQDPWSGENAEITATAESFLLNEDGRYYSARSLGVGAAKALPDSELQCSPRLWG